MVIYSLNKIVDQKCISGIFHIKYFDIQVASPDDLIHVQHLASEEQTKVYFNHHNLS
jgi:hypothetical protein